jgi:ACR3 family arsenite efflux pump ArsB
MTQAQPRTKGEKWLLAALAIGTFQMAGLFGYALSIVFSANTAGTSGATGSDVSPTFLAVIYISFALLIGLVLRGISRRNGSARTPFLLIQGFSLVVAQALISGSETFEVALGWFLVAIGLAGAYAIMTSAVSSELNIQR